MDLKWGLKWSAPVLLLLLAGCGYKGALTRLEPPDPALSKPEQKAARTQEKRRVADGLAVPAAVRPVRVDELTVKLGVRPDDAFNLPPEGTRTSRVIAFPGEEIVPDDRPLPLPSAAAAPPETGPEHR
ncbi:MAG: lipoprotein [Sandaracinobacteroides sp.]